MNGLLETLFFAVALYNGFKFGFLISTIFAKADGEKELFKELMSDCWGMLVGPVCIIIACWILTVLI